MSRPAVGPMIDLLLPDAEVPVTVDGMTFWLNPTDRGVGSSIAIFGNHERQQKVLLAEFIKPGMHIIDVGANIGDYSLWFAKLVGAQGRVWAFEPSLATFELLRRNIRANGLSNIVAANKAVAERNGSCSFFLSAKQSGCASMFEHNVPAVTGRVEVQTVALDEFIEQVGIDKLDIVKIDAQGAEWQILRGASKCWRRFRPLCVLEFWPDGLTRSRADPTDLLRFVRATWPSVYLVRSDSDPAQLQVASDQQILDYCGEHGGYCDLFLR